MLAFFNDLAAIHWLLPPLFKTLLILMAGLAAWALASLPGHWLYQGLRDQLRAAGAIIERKAVSVRELSSRCFAARNAPTDAFVSRHAQMQVLAEENLLIRDELRESHLAAATVQDRLEALRNSIAGAQRSAKEATTAVSRAAWPKDVDVPTPQDSGADLITRDDALLRVIGATIGIAALVTFNTFMINEFLAYDYPKLIAGVIRTSMLLALAFTVIELVFGVVFSFLEGNGTGTILAKCVLIVCLAGLAVFEFTLYTGLGLSFSESIFAPVFAPDKPPFITKFVVSVFGPIIVVALAMCGHLLMHAIRDLQKKTVVRRYRSWLVERTSSADAINTKVNQAQLTAKSLSQSLKEVQAEFAPTADGIGEGTQALVEAAGKFEAAVARAVAVRLEPTRPLDEAEMRRTLYRSAFLSIVAVVALAALYLCFVGTPGLSVPAWCIGLGEGTLLIGAGMIVSKVAHHIARADGLTTAVSVGKGPAVAGYTAVAACVAANGFFLLPAATIAHVTWFSISVAASAILFSVGRQVGLIIAACWTILQSVAILAASATLFVTSGLLLAIKISVDLLRAALFICSLPYKLVFRSRGAPAHTQAMAEA